MSERYGEKRIKQSLLLLLVGKFLSVIAGLMVLLLVVRHLTVKDFAVYAVLTGLVEMVTAVSGVGSTQAVLRYIPQLYAHHQAASTRNLVVIALAVRTSAMSLMLYALYFFSSEICALLNIDNGRALDLFLLLIAARSTGYFLSQVLESTLHQGWVQAAFLIGTLIRLGGVYFYTEQNALTVNYLIAIEIAADGITLLLFVLCLTKLFFITSSQAGAARGGSASLKGITSFTFFAYLQHLAILPFGSDTNRLIAGAMLNSKATASFGLSLSLYEYLRRYLPVQIMLGVIRPVLLARYSTNKNSGDLTALGEGCFQINLIVVGAAVVVLSVGAGDMVSVIFGHQYGAETAILITALLGVLVLESHRVLLDIFVQAIERYQILIFANIVLSLSAIPSLMFAKNLGAMVFPLSGGLALLAANALTMKRLKRQGIDYKISWKDTLLTASIVGSAMLSGSIFKALFNSWLLGVIAAVLLYATANMLLRQELFQRSFSNLMRPDMH